VAPRGTLSVNFLNYLVSNKGLGGGGGRGVVLDEEIFVNSD